MEVIGIPSVNKHLGNGLKELKASSPDSFKLFAFFTLFGTSRLSLLLLIAAIQRKRNDSKYKFPWNDCCVLPDGMFDHPSWREISTVLKRHKLFKCQNIPGSLIEWVSIEPEVCELTQNLLEKSERERLIVLAVDGLQFLISYLSLKEPSRTMTFIPNMKCLWKNARHVGCMTDGSPNFSLAALQMFLSHFRLSEKTMDLAWEVSDYRRRRQSELIYKRIGVSGEKEQKTGVSLREIYDMETKAIQYRAEARYDKGIEVLNDALEQAPCWTRLARARDELYSNAEREALKFLGSELELRDPPSEPINEFTLESWLSQVKYLHKKVQPQPEIDTFYLHALRHGSCDPGDQCSEI
jgi:hypothetical protein